MKSAVVLLLALAVVAGAAAAEPAKKHTSAGVADAKKTLLKLTDLGSGWTAKAAGTSSPTFTCKGYAPKLGDIVETGSATSPDFSAGTTGPFIVQETGVYSSAAQASALFARAVKPGLAKCAEETLQTISSHGIKVTVTEVGALPFAKVTPHTAAYRVVATLKSSTQTLKTYFDLVVVGTGSTVTELTFSSFEVAPPAAVEKALAEVVVRRVTGAPTA